jgi:hypothetical protein
MKWIEAQETLPLIYTELASEGITICPRSSIVVCLTTLKVFFGYVDYSDKENPVWRNLRNSNGKAHDFSSGMKVSIIVLSFRLLRSLVL